MTDHPELPECLEVETGERPDSAVIWLHGLGADGHDFEPIVPQLGFPPQLATRFIFPHAPMRPVTINGGMVMRAWYDILGMDLVRREDEAGIADSASLVRALMERENARGIGDERIVLAGFSQGGAIALHTGLRHPRRVAGILALSTYLPLASRLGSEAGAANRDTPIMLAHGTYDPMIPVALAEATRALLADHGYTVSWHTYPIQHAVCMEEIADIGRWLVQRLGRDAVS